MEIYPVSKASVKGRLHPALSQKEPFGTGLEGALPAPMIDMVYTPEEIAKRLKVAGGTIRNLIKKGKLFAFQVGDQYRIPQYAIDAWLSPMRGVDWESIGFGLWKRDHATKNPVRYVKKLRNIRNKSVKDYLMDIDSPSSK